MLFKHRAFRGILLRVPSSPKVVCRRRMTPLSLATAKYCTPFWFDVHIGFWISQHCSGVSWKFPRKMVRYIIQRRLARVLSHWILIRRLFCSVSHQQVSFYSRSFRRILLHLLGENIVTGIAQMPVWNRRKHSRMIGRKMFSLQFAE